MVGLAFYRFSSTRVIISIKHENIRSSIYQLPRSEFSFPIHVPAATAADIFWNRVTLPILSNGPLNNREVVLTPITSHGKVPLGA